MLNAEMVDRVLLCELDISQAYISKQYSLIVLMELLL